jgi:hypothetical protein
VQPCIPPYTPVLLVVLVLVVSVLAVGGTHLVLLPVVLVLVLVAWYSASSDLVLILLV